MGPARRALALLIAINLFSYLDRYVLAAVLPVIQETFLQGDPNANAKAGWLTSAFFISYMLTAPVFGWLADRSSRWVIIGSCAALWSLASGASGLAATFLILLATRIFLGIGEAGYGPAAPTIISDYFPVERRGRVMSWFYMAIPVGSALGYAYGGLVGHHLGWRWAFYLVTPPGLLLAALCFFMPDPRHLHPATAAAKPTARDYAQLFRIRSLVANIGAQTAFTFAMGGLGVWAPSYINKARGLPLDQANAIFGGILAATGLVSTLLGGMLSDKLRHRFTGSYFLVSGAGMILGAPAMVAMLFVPFPYAWGCIFVAMFCLFLNTGPSNTAIANVTPPHLRAVAFALNILVIHALGDVISPPLIGWVADHYGWNVSFEAVAAVMILAGVIWIAAMRSLEADTRRVEAASPQPAV